MKEITLFKTALIILLLIVGGTLAVVSSGVLTQTVIGPQGDIGPKGDAGPTGLPGPKGDSGAAGPTGAQGTAGANGVNGVQGPKGDTGETGQMGATGPAGGNGSTWLTGSGVPTTNLGNNGDYYINTANNDVYNKISGTWTTVTNIKGETGATGAQGPPGIGVVIKFNDTYSQSSISLSTDYKTVSNVTLTAPSDGYVILNVNAMAKLNGDSTVAALGLGTTSDSYPNLYKTYAGTEGGTDATSYRAMSVQTVVPVTGGNTYTFFANGYLVTAMHTADLYYVYMTGIFYPA